MTSVDSASKRDPRAQSVWDLHDFGVGRGVEIGPLFRPLVHRHEADVKYLDVFDQAGLQAHYAGDEAVPTEQIVEVDFALEESGTIRTMAEVAGAEAPYSWFVASHVIEHVPDVIGWLSELAELVEDDGTLVLIIPDMRYTFDLFRPATTVGTMLQANLDGDTSPSVRAVFDFFHDAITVGAGRLWQRSARPSYADRMYDLATAREQVERSKSTYVDAHVWMFTPELFVQQMHDLRLLGKSAWFVELIEPTRHGELEFVVRLHRLPRDADPAAAEPAGEVLPTAVRPGWDVVTVPSETSAAQSAEIARLRNKVKKQRQTIASQRQRLDDMTSSRRWRAAGLLATPVDRLRRRHSS